MALVVNDRVKETSTTTGTGTLTLAGAVTGFETFSSAIGNTNTTYYSIVNENGEFEVGLGTVGAGTLARTTIISSSNSDSAVNFSAGTKDVFCTLPASKAVIKDASGNIVANNGSNLTALNATQLTSGTVPDARFPSTLPALNGSALTNLNATALASGTVANARLDAQLQDVAGLATTSGKIIQGDGSNFGLSAYTLPTSDGSSAQVLTTNGSGAVTFQTPTVGDITAVTAGTGLTGGGTSGDVTLNVGAGTGVTVNANDIAIGQSVATSASPTFAGLTTTADINFGDNDKAIFGAGPDLQIYHDGSNSYINETGTGGLVVKSGVIYFRNPSDHDMIFAQSGGAVSLYHNNSKKLETTSAGIQTTGTVNVNGAYTLPTSDGSANQVLTTDGSGAVTFATPTTGDITGVTAGTLLDGGGTSGTVTLNVDLSELSTSTTNGDGDFFVVVDSANAQKKLTKGNINNSGFNNDAGYTTNVGDITGVTAGTNLTGGGTSGSVTINLADASTSAKGAASFSSDNFAASSGAITIKDSGVATAEIQDSAVTTAKIADSNVTLAKMAANSVGENQYVDNSIKTAHISNDQITNALIEDNAVDTTQINDNAVGLAQMASGTDGNIISYDTSGNPVAVATGSSGQVLTSAGAGAVPSFQTPTVGDITGVTAGTLLDGGGTSGSVTLNVDLSELSTSTSDGDGDFFVVVDSSNAQKKLTKGNINNSGFNNDAGYTTNTGDITSVVAGSGLTGGATSGAATLNVGAGTGIDVAADAISVDVSDFMTNGSNNRVLTATGTDAMNGEANLTFDGSTLTVTGAAAVAGHITPGANDTYDLGSTSAVWRNVYTGDLHLSNEGKEEGNAVDGTKGNWTIQEGENDLYILNNKSGKKYKFKLEEM